MENSRPDLSVVVPTYRNGAGLADLSRRVLAVFDAERIDGELILVNDQSPDDTWQIVERLAAADQRIHGVDLLANHGQAEATICGLAHANGALVATMDDDLQQLPEDLPVLLRALDDDPSLDCVVGSWERDQKGRVKRMGSWIHARVDEVVHGTPRGFRHTSFRVLRRPLVAALVAHETRTPVLGPLVSQMSGRIANVEVRHQDRHRGRSTIGIRESVSRVVTNAIHGTEWPLHFITAVGVAASILSVLVGALFLARWIAGVSTPPGWASVFLATVFFGGLVLLAIATIGRYLAVVLQETRGRPRWSVRRVTTGVATEVGSERRRPELRAVELDQQPDVGVDSN